jgi:P2 family phage contractile tail tube protein
MQILRNFTWWVDGSSLHLELEELTPPAITDKTEELRIAGMGLDVALGLEKLEASAKLFTRNPDVMAKMGLAPGKRIRSTFRGHTVSELDGTSQAEIITMEHRISGKSDAWKGGDKSGFEYTLNSIIYYEHTVDSRLLHKIDPQNYDCIVDGVNIWQDARQALGIGF